jgi:hypothetical protein
MTRLATCIFFCAALFASGCSTVIRPTQPTNPLAKVTAPAESFRFVGDEVEIREPGEPLAPSRTWQREVANYTARTLNELARSTTDVGPAAHTIVTFDLASPSTLQIGTWKEMTITLVTTLPNGQVVRSKPVTQYIDDTWETAAVTSMGIAGTVLDIGAALASIYFVFTQTFEAGAIFVGALVGGVLMNFGQSAASYAVAGQEEERWSDMYQQAMIAHMADIRARPAPPPVVVAPAPPPTPVITPPAPATVPPPPALLDPAGP